MFISQQMNKAIKNEDTSFFDSITLSPNQQRLCLEKVVGTGQFLMIHYFLSKNYITHSHDSILQTFCEEYDRPDILEHFMTNHYDLSFSQHGLLVTSIKASHYKNAKCLIKLIKTIDEDAVIASVKIITNLNKFNDDKENNSIMLDLLLPHLSSITIGKLFDNIKNEDLKIKLRYHFFEKMITPNDLNFKKHKI